MAKNKRYQNPVLYLVNINSLCIVDSIVNDDDFYFTMYVCFLSVEIDTCF